MQHAPAAATIQLLDAVTIDQMAAGEVVERPAQVAKELVENAFDAGATQVDVVLEGGGLTKLVVIDNGLGMAPADADRCILRHATSKLRQVSDLMHLTTLGFRGEALSSIAAVSELTLTTRAVGAEVGYRLHVHGGVVHSARPIGCAQGTQIVVDNLFYNVPARRKFMRGKATEQAHVQEALLKVALAARRGGLRLRTAARTLLDVPTGCDALARAQLALGETRCATALIDRETDGVAVTGVLTAQPLERGESRRVWLFVNGRFVRDRSLQRAALTACGDHLGRATPTALIYVDLAADAVDVNVHPQKSEVRFVDTAAVHHAVTQALSAAAEAWHKEELLAEQARPARQGPEADATGEGDGQAAPRLVHSFTGQRAFVGASGGTWRAPKASGAAWARAQARPSAARAAAAAGPEDRAPWQPAEPLPLPHTAAAPTQTPSPWTALVPLGTAPEGHLCCRQGTTLALVALQPAWRALLMRLLVPPQGHPGAEAPIACDRLMMPAAWTPPPVLLPTADDHLIETARATSPWGLQLEAVGPGAFVVMAVPQALSPFAPAAVAHSLMEALSAEPEGAATAFAPRRVAVVGRLLDGLLAQGLPVPAGGANVWGPGFLRQLHEACVPFEAPCAVVLTGPDIARLSRAL